MLTGQKPFVGDDVSDTLTLVLKFEPEWEALPTVAALGSRTGAVLTRRTRPPTNSSLF